MLTYYKTILWLGIILILIPFLGIPKSWKDITLFIIGLILIAISLFINNKLKTFDNKKDQEEIFVENNDQDNLFEREKMNKTEEKQQDEQQYKTIKDEEEQDKE